MTSKTNALLGLICATLAMPLAAHEGEDHGAPAEVEQQVDEAPRAAATTESFELVAVAGDGRLVLYLDRFATNEPVAGARVEVESGSFTAEASETAPGVYAAAAPALEAPGAHPLTITVEAGDTADLISTTLQVAGPASPAAQPPAAGIDRSVGRFALLAGVGGVAVVAAGWIAARARRRRNRIPKDVQT